MAIVSGIPGFTQLTNLNVIDQLRVNGTLISDPSDVVIQTVDDLPAPSGGFHQLESNTVYDFKGKDVISENWLEFGTDTLIRGDSPEVTSFTYTGTGAALRGTDVTLEAQTIFISHMSGDLLSHESSSGDHLVLLSRVNSVGLNIGVMGNQAAAVFDSSSMVGINEGLSYSAGATSSLFLCDLAGIVALGGSSIAMDWGDAVIGTISMNASNILGSNISMSGATGSANVVGEAIINGCRFTNTTLSGITKKDSRWLFSACNGIVSSTVYGSALLKDNLTTTSLTQNTPAPILGTFIEPSLVERTSTSAAGVITVSNIQSQTGTVFVSLNLVKDGAGTPTVLVTLRKNGVDVSDVQMSIDVTNRAASVSFSAPVEFIDGDAFQIYLENITNDTDMIVGDAQFLLSSSGGL